DPAPDLFAVRVSGSSMDGGPSPLRDGDWAVMRPARGQAPDALEGRVVLIEVQRGTVQAQYQIKRLKRQGGAWELASDNPEGPTIPVLSDDVVAIARLARTGRAE